MKQQSPARPEPDRPVPTLSAPNIQPPSPSFPLASVSTSGSQRKIAIAVDLSDESSYAVRWAAQNYLRPGDMVILLHVRPMSALYGADWGSGDLNLNGAAAADTASEESQQKLEEDFDNFTTTKASDLAQPLVDAEIPFKIHIVKDHDMKERLCLEVERLGLSAVIMGSRGFGATKRSPKGRLGSVSDYCVRHSVCPVVVVRYPEDKDGSDGGKVAGKAIVGEEVELYPVPEEEHEDHDASDELKGLGFDLGLSYASTYHQKIFLKLIFTEYFIILIAYDSDFHLVLSIYNLNHVWLELYYTAMTFGRNVAPFML